jgi:DNA polymerase-3 subunit beta
LREALAVVNGVIPVKSTRPAIENVYIAASDDAVELVGTDLEVAVRYRLDEVKVEEPGTALVPARIAADFVRDLGGETATVETKKDGCTITGGTDHCELVTIDPDEFPVVPRFVETGSISLQAGNFSKLVNRTAFAAAREQGRYAMHGILTQVKDDTLKLVATDGRRLAVTFAPVDAKGGPDRQAIVPTKGMQLFCRVMDDPLESVKLQFDDNQICLKTRHAEIFARLIDGDFPRYEAVIPTSTENSVEAVAEVLTRKLRLVANVTSADTRAVRLSFGKDQVEINGRSAGTGAAAAQLEADVRGKPGPIAFNPDYLIDGLKNCESELVRLEFNEKTSPGKFTLGENYLYVVMPITVDS